MSLTQKLVAEETKEPPLAEENAISFPVAPPNAKEITDIGLVFNDKVGTKTHRVAVHVLMDATMDQCLAYLKANIVKNCVDPSHPFRVNVLGSKIWYDTESTSEELFDRLVIVGDRAKGREIRRDIRRDRVEPLAYALLEQAENGVYVSWMFRHDLIDGFRFTRAVLRMVFESSEMVYDKLVSRYEASQQKLGCVMRSLAAVGQWLYCLLGAPYALIYLLWAMTSYPRPHDLASEDPFYLNIVCSLKELRARAPKSRGVGQATLNDTINAAMSHAFFAADREAKDLRFALNTLIPDPSPLAVGNGAALKIIVLKRDDARTVDETAEIIGKQTNSVTNFWMYTLSSLLVFNYTCFPKCFRDWFGNRHDAWDFLLSNVPAFHDCSPNVLEYCTTRETTEWTPNILYCVGNQDKLTFDLYFTVPKKFDRKAFRDAFVELVGAKSDSTDLPRYW